VAEFMARRPLSPLKTIGRALNCRRMKHAGNHGRKHGQLNSNTAGSTDFRWDFCRLSWNTF